MRATQEGRKRELEGDVTSPIAHHYSLGDDRASIGRPMACHPTTFFGRRRFARPGAAIAGRRGEASCMTVK
ncbi:hypothetical protein BD311DRAFT_674269 [Dichomitus squalens]|uniref:Uncharacterized protein n=2 Tax=Dichomitus squalens TaxID=114155 RepID=A0A4Q9M9Z6_9APHY|nr:hypothetical protein BD311DRAFT_674269 [Dichomitus squalens]